MSDLKKTPIRWVEIDENSVEQRIDNYLIHVCKDVPKSMIYKIVRKGEVRVNKKRVKPEYKLQMGDIVRIPPMYVEDKINPLPSAKLQQVEQLTHCVLYEDDYFLVLNKPSGMAVHGGSGVPFGIIEALRSLRGDKQYLELVHRLDKDTSGCLLVAKKRSGLRALQTQLRNKSIQKDYLTLVRGRWSKHDKNITAPLLKVNLASGEQIVRVDTAGKPSQTRYKIEQFYNEATLVKASPITGRTHQIRVHCQSVGHLIAGDPKYGDAQFNTEMAQKGLHRLFLHAFELRFKHPHTEAPMFIQAPLPHELTQVLEQLKKR
ncbi:MAG: 23S rRNA pseudouridine(955/2504/2580) synthase RluC [Shewanellaceae bacterium]|nr:23S rRNA pseudouridine(955/2504/2580) synthase RluC [Shewanellaceae bacterium]